VPDTARSAALGVRNNSKDAKACGWWMGGIYMSPMLYVLIYVYVSPCAPGANGVWPTAVSEAA
jgi:hypothetical protein